MKKVLSLILVMLISASVMAGCTTLEKTATGDYDKGAIIDMYLADRVYNLDPHADLIDDNMLRVLDLVFERLTSIGEDGKWQYAAMKNYSVVETDEEYSVVIDLTSNCWSDGRTVQAADFVYAWKRLVDPNRANEAAAILTDVKNAHQIKLGDATVDDLGVAAIDTYTLQIDFERKVDLDVFFANCASIALAPLREDIITRYGDDVWALKTTTVLTNGPFAVKELSDNTLRIERSQYYRLDKNKDEYLDKYVIPYRLLTKYETGDLAAQLSAYENGNLFYDGVLPLASRAQYKDTAVVTDMLATHTYVFNTSNELFAKAEVRQALSLAIDRNAIAELLTFAKPATGYLPSKVFDTTVGTSFRSVGGDILSASADTAKAQSLLSAAGVKGGEFTLTVRDNEVDKAIAEAVAAAWNKLGFKVTVNAVAADKGEENSRIDNLQKLYSSGEFDVIAIDTMMSADAFAELSKFALEFSGNGVDMNSPTYDLYGHVSGYNSQDYNAIIASAYAEKDTAARVTILHQAEEKLLADMPVIPVVFLQDAYLNVGDLSGIENTYYGTRNFKRTELKDYMTYKAATDTSAAAEEPAAE